MTESERGTPAAHEDLDADIVIVGGGLAGLSLACHILRRGLDKRRMIVLEGRTTYRDDRHWCSWMAPSHPFAACIEASWTRWQVAAGERQYVQELVEQPYSCIPAGKLYREAQRQLQAAPNATLRLGSTVLAVHDRGEHAEVVLSGGESVRAAYAFDSRVDTSETEDPGVRDENEVTWTQDFLGWRIRTLEPAFDARTVTLMQFSETDHDVRFVYTLPFSSREALVEATAFSPFPVPDEQHVRVLQDHLDRILGLRGYEISRDERGRVPMTTRPIPEPKSGARVLPIGTAAGMVKPSTGYSFETVQRWSADIAEDLAAGRTPVWRPPRSLRTLAMDRMFLAFMRRYPARMPELFVRMFADVPADALIRFLSDRGGLRDAAAVAMALPKLAMLGEAIRSLRIWARSA